MPTPQTRFAKSGDVYIAYQALGDGPIDLVYVQGAFTHLDVMWELPAFRHFCEQLAQFTRLIWFDKRGMGLSERVTAAPLEVRMDDVRAVMDATDSARAILLGESEGGPLSMLFAAAHPERTRALVLCGAEVREERDDAWPWGESTSEEFERSIATLAERWGPSSKLIDYLAPSLATDPFARDWVGRLLVNAGTPNSAEAFIRMAFGIDVRDIVPTIRVPTLIIHRSDDQLCSVENGRFLARSIPDSTYVELAGADHAPWSGEGVVEEIREFVTGVREPQEPDRILATVLFTDIVGSTERAADLGDRRWRELLAAHHRVVRGELARFRGREIDTAGDGFLAAFDGPARALRAAQSIVDSVVPLGIEVRAGVHTGECEVVGSDLVGVAVHIGARVAALSGASEVLTTSTVRDLVAGSGLNFEDRGTRALKGLSEEWHLYVLA